MKRVFESALVGRGPGGAWTFLPVPFNAQEVFGSKARIPVAGTLQGQPFRNSLLPNGDGTHSMPVNKDLQSRAKVKVGDAVKVEMDIDSEPRDVVVPDDFAAALSRAKASERLFSELPYSHRKEFIDWIADAKKTETRIRRIEKSIELLAAGKKRVK